MHQALGDHDFSFFKHIEATFPRGAKIVGNTLEFVQGNVDNNVIVNGAFSPARQQEDNRHLSRIVVVAPPEKVDLHRHRRVFAKQPPRRCQEDTYFNGEGWGVDPK